jgi:hypothetical protein
MGRVDKRKKREREKRLAAKARQTITHIANRDEKRIQDIRRYGHALTRRQFDAFCFCRMPLVRFTAEEMEWYSVFENRLLV